MYIDQEARDKIIEHLEMLNNGYTGRSMFKFINSIPVYDSPEFKEAPL